MSYTIVDSAVLWSGKKLKDVEPHDFEIMGDCRFAKADDVVLMRGKPLNVDAASFTLLNSNYAKDRVHVFLIMDAKLKPVEKADAATFEAVGDWFGKDKLGAWCDDKMIKNVVLASFGELGKHYSFDQEHMYFRLRPIKLKEKLPFDFAAARMITARETNHVNIADFLLVTEDHAVYVEPRYDLHEVRHREILTRSPWKLRHLNDLRMPSEFWTTDENRVFWRGEDVGAYNAQSLVVYDDGVALVDGQLVAGGSCDATKAIDASTVCYLGDDHFMDGAAIFKIDVRRGKLNEPNKVDVTQVAKREPLDGKPPAHVEQFMRAATTHVFMLRDQMGYEDHYRDVFEHSKKRNPATDLTALTVSIAADVATLQLGDHNVSGKISGWYRLGCHLWALNTGSDTYYQPYPHFHYMQSDGMSAQDAFFKTNMQDALRAAQALLLSGFSEEAHFIAVQAIMPLTLGGQSELPEIGYDVLSKIDPVLLSHKAYVHRYHEITASTYLAGGRKAVESGLLEHNDFRTRYELIALMHGLTVGTAKDARYLTDIMPYVQKRYDAEPIGFLKDYLLCILDAACRRSVSDSDWRLRAKPILEYLIEKNFNTDVNRRRLEDADI